MDKCIKWYKRISLLSLFLFMFGILLINICIIGFSVGSDNIANAAYVNYNQVNNNLLDGYFLDGHELVTSSNYESGKWFVSSGVTVTSSDSGLTVSYQGSSTVYFMYFINTPSSSSVCLSLYASTGNLSSIQFYNYNFTLSNDFSYLGSNSSNSSRITFFTASKASGVSGVSGFGIGFNNTATVKLSWIKCEIGTNFTGQPLNTYTPNGYDQGYTDGVNNASGTISGIVDLTNVTWEVPDETTTASVAHQYNISGTVGDFNFDILGMLDYGANLPIFDNDSSLSKPFILIDFNPLTQTFTQYFIKPGDIITFTGGEDVTNADLIQWLEDNNTFKTYTDGYNDGYDIGYDLGYQEGLLYSDYQHGFDDGYNIGVDVGSQFLFSGFHLTEGNYTSGYVTSEFIADSKKYRGTLTRSSGQTNYLDDSVGTSSLIADGIYYAAYKIGSFTDGFAFSTYVGANAYPNDDVNSNLVYFYVIMLDPLNQTYIKVRLVDYSIILNRLRKNLTDYNNYYFKYIFPTDNSYDCYLVYDGYYNNTSIGQYLSAYQLQNFMTYYYDPDTVSDEYNTGVTVGYNEGYLQGNEEGYNSGYADYQAYGEQNYDLGYYNGHMIGYQEGLLNGSTNEYGFHTLLGAVFDVPVQTINGLLDFEILGVNMKGFYLGLISLCIALFILKIVFK